MKLEGVWTYGLAGVESDWNSVGQGRSVTWPLHLRVRVAVSN